MANPMAPTVKPKHRSTAKSKTSATAPTLAADLGAATPAPQFLVPPGTEPSLAVPTLGFMAYGHEFGFPAGLRRATNHPNVAQHPHTGKSKSSRSHLTTNMSIDPVLLNNPPGPSKTIAIKGSLKRSHRDFRDKEGSTEDSSSEDSNEDSNEDSKEDGDDDGGEDKAEDNDRDGAGHFFQAEDHGGDHNTENNATILDDTEGLDGQPVADYNSLEDELNRDSQSPVGFGSFGDNDFAADGQPYHFLQSCHLYN